MRRIVIAAMGTLSTLVMLFAFDASHRAGGGVTTALGGGGAQASGDGGTVSSATDGNGTLGAGPDGSAQATDAPSPTSDGAATSSGSTPAATRRSGATSTKKAPTSGTKTYTGDTVMTQWGPVQVQITVRAGKMVRSRAVVYPNGNDHDIAINNYALPILDQATVQLQSSTFDNISGATVTTDGYRQSLQSALDQAHL